MKRPITLDLSRLVWRARHATPSGIDRVERAYAGYFLGQAERDVQVIVRMGAWGARAVNPARLGRFLERLDGGWEGRTPAPSGASAIADLVTRSSRPKRRSGATAIIPSHQNWHRREWLAELRGADGRLVLFLHDTIPSDLPEYAREGGGERHEARLRNGLAFADAFIVNSHATGTALRRFAARHGADPKAVVAPIGVSPEWQPGAVPSDGSPYFVCIGTIEPRKNHLLLLHVWRRFAEQIEAGAIPESQVPHLVIVGRRGWENENILDMLDRSRAMRRLVTEHNTLADRALLPLLRGARALLMPSFAEGFGMPVNEALGVGTPVIAADLPVYRETAGEVPCYLDPLDGPGWMRAITDYSSPTSRLRTEQLARITAWSRPRWNDHFARVTELLDELDQ